jgi:hypothetical protein
MRGAMVGRWKGIGGLFATIANLMDEKQAKSPEILN